MKWRKGKKGPEYLDYTEDALTAPPPQEDVPYFSSQYRSYESQMKMFMERMNDKGLTSPLIPPNTVPPYIPYSLSQETLCTLVLAWDHAVALSGSATLVAVVAPSHADARLCSSYFQWKAKDATLRYIPVLQCFESGEFVVRVRSGQAFIPYIPPLMRFHLYPDLVDALDTCYYLNGPYA